MPYATRPKLRERLAAALPRRVAAVTHDGRFHADEVFVAAMLKLLFGKQVRIQRTRDPWQIEAADLAFDVGGVYSPDALRFDHHAPAVAGCRDNGVPYAAAGLFWTAHGPEVVQAIHPLADDAAERVAAAVDALLIQPIDAVDNGVPAGGGYGVSLVIGGFNPTWLQQGEDNTPRFANAVLVAQDVLRNAITEQAAVELARSHVEVAVAQERDGIVELPQGLPWQEVVCEMSDTAHWAVYPVASKAWHVCAVPVRPGSFSFRKGFPAPWAGKRGPELAAVTGVDDAHFCHAGRWLAGALSKEGALKLAYRAGEQTA